ncbi:histidine kinase [Catenulispora acidiphila DSM 44928]|uniref:histidine kinase n=2 Tax=Catenulispora TaxID=414878 RepID=C7PX72_CATAD|nr:histidine kinase [Catenulispora acidiphila DSM 44928]
MRLTLLYAALFLASGIVLLAVALYLVFRNPILVTFDPTPPSLPSPMPGRSDVLRVFRPATGTVSPTWATVRAAAAQSAGVLAAMAAVSTLLGWIVAGRVLSPLRTMAFRTRRISEQNLHERLALTGPRDEMTELATTIDGLLGRLEAAFEAQRRFIANASHELRTPLAMMRTSLDVAVAKPGRPREVDVLGGKLREGLDAADRLLEGLLLLARTQNVERMETSAVSLPDLLDAALHARRATIEDKRLLVEQKVEPVLYRGNDTLLASLVDNLVDNAIRHNEPGGWLRAQVTVPRGEHDRTRIIVENGGPLLTRAEVDLLGQPFQRLGSQRTSQPGTGLGLSIIAAIAEVHHGRLLLQARDEGGLRAEVEL